jgi:hypothetical protein
MDVTRGGGYPRSYLAISHRYPRSYLAIAMKTNRVLSVVRALLGVASNGFGSGGDDEKVFSSKGNCHPGRGSRCKGLGECQTVRMTHQTVGWVRVVIRCALLIEDVSSRKGS